MITRETPIEALQLGVDPVVTALVQQQPQIDALPGNLILPPVTVGSWAYTYIKGGDESLQRYDGVERGMRSDIRHSDTRIDRAQRKLRRFSFMSGLDVDEIANSNFGYDVQAAAAGLSKSVVDLAIERVQRDLIIASTSYTTTPITIAGGSEWDQAAGDVYSDVQTAAADILALTGLRPGLLTLSMSVSAFNAALQDDKFRESTFRQGIVAANEGSLAMYLGVKEVRVFGPIERVAGVTTALYGDIAILHYTGGVVPGAPLAGMNNRLVWGVTAKWNGGTASTRFYNPENTSWWWPWNDYADPFILNPDSAVLIKNCSSLA
jgi:hypothetical protein